jgi:glycosyltransferase involved in cell wall biosynthesis
MEPITDSDSVPFGSATAGFRPFRLVVLVPAYNPGSILFKTVQELLGQHPDVWVLVDGSNDGSDKQLKALSEDHTGFRLFSRSWNIGKGATILEGTHKAAAECFTHVLCFDADGQHPPWLVPEFRRASELNPRAIVMGEPMFAKDAPLERVYFRRVANFFAQLETGGRLRWDCMFGMRVYPVEDLLAAFSRTARARHYDFDTEIAVRMVWAGVDVVGMEAPVRYPGRTEGGVTHFRYCRDNFLLAGMHVRLLIEGVGRFLRARIA